MRRCFEPVDLMAGVGLCVTVLAAYLFFAAANGTLARGSAIGSPPAAAVTAMDWIQPALAEAIVQDAVVSDQASHHIVQAAIQLNGAIVAAELAGAAASVPFEGIRSQSARANAQHAARVQFVLGRRIAEFTSRGVRVGVLSAERPNAAYNRRLIDLARADAPRMDAEFSQVHQSTLGQAIVSRVQELNRWTAQSQERLGRSLFVMTMVQEQYEAALRSIQEQIGSLAFASTMTELRADLFDRLAAADYPQASVTAFAAPRSWPEMPLGLLIAATGLLAGIFAIGLRLAAGEGREEADREPSSEAPVIQPVRPDIVREGYRKTA